MLRPSQFPNIYFQQLLNTLSITASTMPFAVIGLGLLVRAGVLDNRFYAGDTMYGLISAGFIVASVANTVFVLMRKGPKPKNYLFLSITYHFLAAAFLLFITGVNTPFIIGWILLVIATDTYFGTLSAYISLSVLLAAEVATFSLHPFLSLQERIEALIIYFFIAATCIVYARLRTINDYERLDLKKTRDQMILQRERLLALINSLGDAVITTDQKGRIRLYNAATLSLLDTNANLEGKTIDDAVRPTNDKGKRVSLIDEAKKNRSILTRTDLTHTFSDNDIMRLYINIAPVQPSYRGNQGERGFIFLLRDITKEKSLEQERDEFISVVSHELRTPVTIAEGNLSNMQLMLQRGAQLSKLVQPVKDSHEQIVYLAKLVNDLGTLSRAERGANAVIEPTNLTELLNDIYTEYAPQATAKNVRMDADFAPQLPTITTSRLYLQEVLQNLITNAIKYTLSGTITLGAALDGQYAVIAVQDTGIGIGKSDQAHIFEKFYRSEDYRTRQTNGTGLGLYVCKKLTEKLGAKLTFTSRLNHGSRFELRVPLHPLAAPQASPK